MSHHIQAPFKIPSAYTLKLMTAISLLEFTFTNSMRAPSNNNTTPINPSLSINHSPAVYNFSFFTFLPFFKSCFSFAFVETSPRPPFEIGTSECARARIYIYGEKKARREGSSPPLGFYWFLRGRVSTRKRGE